MVSKFKEIHMIALDVNKNAIQHPVITVEEMEALLETPCVDDVNAGRDFESLGRAEVDHVQKKNKILALLSDSTSAKIKEFLEVIELKSGLEIYKSGEIVDNIYFPLSCSAALMLMTTEGETVEVARISDNGFIGGPLMMGDANIGYSIRIQRGGQALRMPTKHFMRLAKDNIYVQEILIIYMRFIMIQMAQSIVCNSHHLISERLSKWILIHSDDMQVKNIAVTHENISQSLGVRRESITQEAGKLQAAGSIINGRGKILLKNQSGLLRSVCECYSKNVTESQKYLKLLNEISIQMLNDPRGQDFDVVRQFNSSNQAELESLKDTYFFAPVGFITLNSDGRIINSNLIGAIMLGISHSQIKNKLFLDFLDAQSQSVFTDFHNEVLGGQCRRSCVINFSNKSNDNSKFYKIEAAADGMCKENRMVLVNLDP